MTWIRPESGFIKFCGSGYNQSGSTSLEVSYHQRLNGIDRLFLFSRSNQRILFYLIFIIGYIWILIFKCVYLLKQVLHYSLTQYTLCVIMWNKPLCFPQLSVSVPDSGPGRVELRVGVLDGEGLVTEGLCRLLQFSSSQVADKVSLLKYRNMWGGCPSGFRIQEFRRYFMELLFFHSGRIRSEED